MCRTKKKGKKEKGLPLASSGFARGPFLTIAARELSICKITGKVQDAVQGGFAFGLVLSENVATFVERL